MKQKSLTALQIVAGLVFFAATGTGSSAMSGVVQQLDVFGPKQWLTLIASSLVPSAPRAVVGPIKARFAAHRAQAPSQTAAEAGHDSTVA